MFEELSPPYATVVADPPWRLENYRAAASRKTSDRPGLPYSTMTVEEICAMPVKSVVAKDAALWLWITAALNRSGIGTRVAEAWGFRLVSEFVWDKPGLGTGNIPRACHEILLIGKRGSVKLDGPLNIRSVQSWPALGHSVKPPAAGDLIESVSPAPYLELFARQPRMGWDAWGLGFEGGT